MIEAAPSTMKNAINSNVSENAPVKGDASSMPPTTRASIAETSDHQKPGACRNQYVVKRPTIPLTINSQPNKMVTVKVANGGNTTAVAPKTSSTTPSTRKRTQCSRNAVWAER